MYKICLKTLLVKHEPHLNRDHLELFSDIEQSEKVFGIFDTLRSYCLSQELNTLQ